MSKTSNAAVLNVSRLQRSLVPPKCRHPIQITVADLMLQCGDDFVFPGEEIRLGKIDAGDRVMGGIRCGKS